MNIKCNIVNGYKVLENLEHCVYVFFPGQLLELYFMCFISDFFCVKCIYVFVGCYSQIGIEVKIVLEKLQFR